MPQAAPETPVRVDVSWLLRNMFRETAARPMACRPIRSAICSPPMA
ncbi:GntR family transcriptional regulator [Bordetella pertussis]|nr:GntR family transcriptional regulator [Bordetella pertussis]